MKTSSLNQDSEGFYGDVSNQPGAVWRYFQDWRSRISIVAVIESNRKSLVLAGFGKAFDAGLHFDLDKPVHPVATLQFLLSESGCRAVTHGFSDRSRDGLAVGSTVTKKASSTHRWRKCHKQ